MASQIDVVLGVHDQNVYEPTQMTFRVTKAIVHPNYDPESRDNDIALLRLSKKVIFNANIQPICLPTVDTADGTVCIATGWGLTSG